MNAQYRPHGSFSTHVEGQLMISEITGPWNKELVEYWGQHSFAQAKALSDAGPYVGIAIIRESMLCPADAFESLRRVVRYSATKLRCIAHVIVADAGVDGRDFIEPLFARVYDGLVQHAIFYNIDDARAWSLALLAANAA
ncbi:MAG: hypothetical protein V4484_18455 [Pseudomonadota bacterium]